MPDDKNFNPLSSFSTEDLIQAVRVRVSAIPDATEDQKIAAMIGIELFARVLAALEAIAKPSVDIAELVNAATQDIREDLSALNKQMIRLSMSKGPDAPTRPGKVPPAKPFKAV